MSLYVDLLCWSWLMGADQRMLPRPILDVDALAPMEKNKQPQVLNTMPVGTDHGHVGDL